MNEKVENDIYEKSSGKNEAVRVRQQVQQVRMAPDSMRSHT